MRDRYELHEEIGRGAGGVIHRATDHDLRRQVAIKRLDRSGSSRLQRLRFVTEAQVPAQLAHPNIIPVHDLGKTLAGDLFYVMKLVKGHTLKERIAQGARRDQVLDWLEQVCRGLGFAHHQGVLHRDIKPSNLMIGAFGEVLILDWGLARSPQGTIRDEVAPMTLDGDVLGSLGYMAPEQARGEADTQGPWTDVHAPSLDPLGSWLCWMPACTRRQSTVRQRRWPRSWPAPRSLAGTGPTSKGRCWACAPTTSWIWARAWFR